MIRTSILHVSDERSALALGRLLRQGTWACHSCPTLESTGALLGSHRRIGVVVVDAQAGLSSFLAPMASLQAARPNLRWVLVVDRCQLAEAVEACPSARVVPGPWRDEVLVATVESAVAEAEAMRSARLASALAARRSARLHEMQVGLSGLSGRGTRMLAEANVRLRQAALGLARLASVMSEGGDPELTSQRERVARIAVSLSRRLGWTPADVEDVRLAALLTDVGKAWGGHASAGAFDLEGTQAERSAQALAPLPFSRNVVSAVRYHHERWDGRGAPEGLRGAEIPRMARMLSLAEAFVALVDDDACGMSDSEAALALREEAGRAHDPEMVAVLVAMSGDAEEATPLAELELAGSLA